MVLRSRQRGQRAQVRVVDSTTCGQWGMLGEPMAQVDFTRHLPTLFPQLDAGPLEVDAGTLAELVQQLDGVAPGVAFYICDELGRLRQHVNIFVDNELLVDRRTLSDRLGPDSRVFIAQALSGG